MAILISGRYKQFSEFTLAVGCSRGLARQAARRSVLFTSTETLRIDLQAKDFTVYQLNILLPTEYLLTTSFFVTIASLRRQRYTSTLYTLPLYTHVIVVRDTVST